MKLRFAAVVLAALCGSAGCHEASAQVAVPAALMPRLDQTTEITDFGQIAFRGPIAGNQGRAIVLFHGIYGGASHLAWKELLPLLDESGARVWIMDLPGAGLSEKRKRIYTLEMLDAFVEAFLGEVVQEPAQVVAESVMGASALRASAHRPELFQNVVWISPTGVSLLSEEPSSKQTGFFDRLWSDDAAAIEFYGQVLAAPSVKYFLEQSSYDDARVTEELITQHRLALNDLDSRYLTLSFVGGKIWRKFSDAASGVSVPVLLIFGENAEAPAAGFPVERIERFLDIRPDFSGRSIMSSGTSPHAEKAVETAREVLAW